MLMLNEHDVKLCRQGSWQRYLADPKFCDDYLRVRQPKTHEKACFLKDIQVDKI